MRKRFYILFLLAVSCTALHAQKEVKKYVYEDSSVNEEETIIEAPSTDEETMSADSAIDYTAKRKSLEPDTNVYFHAYGIAPDSIKEWKARKGFEYRNYLDSLLKAEKKAIDGKKPVEESSSFWDDFFRSGILKILLWIIGIGFVCFILYRLFLTQGAFRRSTRSALKLQPEMVEEEINSNTDFDRLIVQALQLQNYRLAVRYQYIKSLHLLAAKDKIELSADKTNYQYVRELKDERVRQDFASLTLNYEYVWYGEFLIEENIYRKLEAVFKSFQQKI